MNDTSNVRTGMIFDGRVYEIHEHRYGCFVICQGSPYGLREDFPHADAEDVGTWLLKRYRRNERIIQESAV